MTTSSLLLCHFLMNKDRTTSMVSFWRSFAELSNGHRFFYVFLIGWILIFNKHFVPFFLCAIVKSKRYPSLIPSVSYLSFPNRIPSITNTINWPLGICYCGIRLYIKPGKPSKLHRLEKRFSKKCQAIILVDFLPYLSNREKSRSQSSTFWHIREKLGFHFLMRKLGISLGRLGPPMKLIG